MYQRTQFCPLSSANQTRSSHSPSLLPKISRLAAFVVLLFSFAFVLSAQEATIVGSVTDPSGAVVPNAKIVITNTDKNQTRDIVSNEAGQFVVPSLGIGHYTLKAEVSGFKSFEQNDIVLQVGDRLRIDVKLEVGNTKDSVTVEANAIAVQSESGEVSDVITSKDMTQLATNGRSIYALATLTAGASSNMADLSSPTSIGGDANVSFNGLRENHNLWMIDGGEADDRGGAGGLDIMPSLDSIAEFRAMTSNYSAEYGLSSGGTMTMVVKSGNTDFHAAAWEFNRNNALDAGNYFTNAIGSKPPELRLNIFGFNVGGPVTLGKLYNKDRQKTFFFYNQEWRRQISGGLVNATVPTAAQLSGNFSALAPLTVPTAAQINPALQSQLTGAGLTLGGKFPGNQIPTSLFDKNAVALLQAGIFPAANSNGGTQFVGTGNQPVYLREEILRIDHRFSDKFAVFGHYMKDDVSQTYGTSLWSGDGVPTVGSILTNPAYHYVLHATYSITPTILNEVAYNQNGNVIDILPTGTYKRPSSLNIPELFAGNNLNRIPGISLSNYTTYDVSSWPWHNKADDYQVRDDLSWVVGSHQLKMGASWALYKKTQDLFGDTQGSFNFNGLFTGNSVADFLLGYANSYNELAVQDHGQWNNVSPAVYFQDNWHVKPRLTVNLGLRWDGIPHTYEANNRMSDFYPNLYNPANAAIFVPGTNGNAISSTSPGLGTSPNPILAGTQFYLNGIASAGTNNISNGMVKNYWNNFGPRLGFAYDIKGDHRTVIRGGFGTMYERIQGNDMYNGGPNQPFSASVTLQNVSLSNPSAALNTGKALVAPITVGSITGLAYSDYKSPVSYQYSIGVERELAKNSILSISYVGNQNRHQSDQRQIDLPNQSSLSQLSTLPGGTTPYNLALSYPGYSSIMLYENAGNSHYNSLQINMHSQIKRDLTLQVAYTLSRAIDPTNGGDLYTLSNPYNRSYDIGPAPLDRTHIALVNFVYEIPVFRNSQHTALKSVAGGWELSGIVTMESGLPLFLTEGGSLGSNGLSGATNRPNFTGSVSEPGTIAHFFTTSGFTNPAVGQFGNLGKGVFRGPGRNNWNMSLFKSFQLSEARKSRIELRIESFNTWNHTEYQNVSTGFGSGNFGQVTSTWDARVFQLGGKFLW
jgi:hypothetical protein